MSKKIGITLAGGGAKGLSHIGALKILQQNNIPIDAITGTSIGALIGGMYAYHQDLKRIERFAHSLTKARWTWLLLRDFKLFGKGLMSGKHLMGYVAKELPKEIQFSDLKIPLKVVAVDINTGREHVFDSGSVLDAIRASMSLPFTFEPVKIGHKLLVDGSCRLPAPVRLLDTMGVDKKILFATCSKTGLMTPCPINLSMITHVYMMNSTASMIRLAAEDADVTIYPDVDFIDTLQFWKSKQTIREGELAADRLMKEMKKLKGWF